MIVVDRFALVTYTAERMYELVEDVESYPRFLPWCSSVEVRREPGRTIATLHVNYHGIRQNFTTDNTNVPGRSIDIRLVSGPFKHLLGAWRFEPLATEASKVSLHMEYQLSNALLSKMMGPVFGHIANTFVDAFVKRADTIQQLWQSKSV
jgi:ribosome-associated toxin RatA of RatAB toxin-antitoxin module